MRRRPYDEDDPVDRFFDRLDERGRRQTKSLFFIILLVFGSLALLFCGGIALLVMTQPLKAWIVP